MYNFYNLNQNQLKSDPSTGISVDVNVPLDNQTFYKLFESYIAEPTEENQDKFGNYLNTIHYLIGLLPNSTQDYIPHSTQLSIHKGDDINLLICSTVEREVYLPVFTSTNDLKSWYSDPVYTLSVPADWLWRFILSQNNFNGIALNPNCLDWTITREHIQSLLDDITN